MKDHRPKHGFELKAGDTVTVTLKGNVGSYTSAPPVAGAPGMTLPIPPGEIARHLGESVSVFYTRLRNGVSTDSDVLSLQVGDIRDNDPRVALPVFVEAEGGFVLDLNTFTGDATITVAAWPLMAKGQRYWLGVHGDLTWTIADGVTVETVGPVSHTLDRQLIEDLANNARIRLTVHVDFSGGNGDSSRRFDSPAYSVLAAVVPLYINPERVTLTGTQTFTRNASGGKPPYRYISFNSNIVSVPVLGDGVIKGVSTGNTLITAYDSIDGKATYPVTVIPYVEDLTVYPDQTLEFNSPVPLRFLIVQRRDTGDTGQATIRRGLGIHMSYAAVDVTFPGPCNDVEIDLIAASGTINCGYLTDDGVWTRVPPATPGNQTIRLVDVGIRAFYLQAVYGFPPADEVTVQRITFM